MPPADVAPAPEAAVIYYFAAEHGIWVHPLPLLSLPPKLGREVMEMFIKNIPERLQVLQEIKQSLQEIALRGR